MLQVHIQNILIEESTQIVNLGQDKFFYNWKVRD